MTQEIRIDGSTKVVRISQDAEGTFRVALLQPTGSSVDRGYDLLQMKSAGTLKGAQKQADRMLRS
jgi:hypothetical protein